MQFVFGGYSRADEADEVRLAVGVGNDENTTGCVSAHDNPACFLMVVVLSFKGHTVVKYGFSVCQAYFVFLFVRSVFRRVVLTPMARYMPITGIENNFHALLIDTEAPLDVLHDTRRLPHRCCHTVT